MEGLVHKAILELWRPNPSELTLLLTKGIETSLLKVPPTPYALTGSSDPCYVEAYHLADPSDGRISLHLKVTIVTFFPSPHHMRFILIINNQVPTLYMKQYY